MKCKKCKTHNIKKCLKCNKKYKISLFTVTKPDFENNKIDFDNLLNKNVDNLSNKNVDFNFDNLSNKNVDFDFDNLPDKNFSKKIISLNDLKTNDFLTLRPKNNIDTLLYNISSVSGNKKSKNNITKKNKKLLKIPKKQKQTKKKYYFTV